MHEFGESSDPSTTRVRNTMPSFLNPRPLALQDWIFLGIKLAGALTCIYFYFHSPVPGVSVACLAVAAAALSVHRDPNPWQKGLWLLLMAGFLWVELHAIRTDRTEADRHAQIERAEQNEQFKAVRDQQNTEFSTTAQNLQTAIQGIQSTLKTSNALVRLSQPQAVIHVQKVEFSPVPSTLNANQEYWFNIHYTNRGLAPAKETHVSAHPFVARIDDLDAQKQLAGEFEKKWATENWHSQVSSSGEEGFMSTKLLLSQEDLDGIKSGDQSIYILSRIEYSDAQGRWRTDDCEMFQNNPKTGLSLSVMHWCGVFKSQRYRAPANYASVTGHPSKP